MRQAAVVGAWRCRHDSCSEQWGDGLGWLRADGWMVHDDAPAMAAAMCMANHTPGSSVAAMQLLRRRPLTTATRRPRGAAAHLQAWQRKTRRWWLRSVLWALTGSAKIFVWCQGNSHRMRRFKLLVQAADADEHLAPGEGL